MVDAKPDGFFEKIHWLEPPKRTRSEPMQVICVGPSRSGTGSLSQALDMLGYKTYHGFRILTDPSDMTAWNHFGKLKHPSSSSNIPATSTPNPISTDDFDTLLGPFTATADAPSVFFSRDLILAFPNAKVIINYRDVDSWWLSYYSTVFPAMLARESLPQRLLTKCGALRYWQERMRNLTCKFWRCNRPHEIEGRAKWVYEEHVAMVRGLVRGMEESGQREKGGLLEWKVQDGWRPLCDFLGQAMPDEAFPQTNMTGETGQKIMGGLTQSNVDAWTNLGLLIGAGVAVVASVGWMVMRG